MQTEQSYSTRQKLAAQTLEGTKTQCWARLSSGRREIKSKPWLSIPQPTHTRTRANIISNCFFIWSFHLFFFFFSDRSQWTQPLDNSSWNNPYKWMSLVFSPVAHCSVEPYAISVDFGREGWGGGGERERRSGVEGRSDTDKHRVLVLTNQNGMLSLRVWSSGCLSPCAPASVWVRDQRRLSHIHQGPVLITW